MISQVNGVSIATPSKFQQDIYDISDSYRNVNGDLIFQMTKKTLSLLDVRDRFTPDLLTLVDTHRKDNSIFADLPFKV